jgi:hypothetical protein
LEKEGPDSKYYGINKVSVHEIISNCVKDIWDEFYDDANGYLDKNETFHLLKDNKFNVRFR